MYDGTWYCAQIAYRCALEFHRQRREKEEQEQDKGEEGLLDFETFPRELSARQAESGSATLSDPRATSTPKLSVPDARVARARSSPIVIVNVPPRTGVPRYHRLPLFSSMRALFC